MHIIVGLYQNVAAKSGIDRKKVFGLYPFWSTPNYGDCEKWYRPKSGVE